MKGKAPGKQALGKRHQSGFSLLVTVAMMVLLALLAIGLLSLSTTMLRSSSNQNSIAEARANARLALNLALGELQKHAGPDARITASAGLVDLSSNNPHIAGVWSSRRIQPGSPPSARDYSKQGKADLFQKLSLIHI